MNCPLPIFITFCLFFVDFSESARVSSRIVSKISETSEDIGHSADLRDDLSLAAIERRARSV